MVEGRRLVRAENTWTKYSCVLFLRAWIHAQVHMRSAYSMLCLFTLIIRAIWNYKNLYSKYIPIYKTIFYHFSRKSIPIESIFYTIRYDSINFSRILDKPCKPFRFPCSIVANTYRFAKDKDRRVYIQQVVSCMVSSLESSETVTIILYNRYNSNASYAIVARRQREEGRRVKERSVLIRKTLFTIASINWRRKPSVHHRI